MPHERRLPAFAGSPLSRRQKQQSRGPILPGSARFFHSLPKTKLRALPHPAELCTILAAWRGARAADRAALEMPCARKGTVGSNPTLSALFERGPAKPCKHSLCGASLFSGSAIVPELSRSNTSAFAPGTIAVPIAATIANAAAAPIAATARLSILRNFFIFDLLKNSDVGHYGLRRLVDSHRQPRRAHRS